MATPEEQELRERISRIDPLIAAVEAGVDSAARESALELVQTILAIHGAGIERMMDLAWESGPAGQELIEQYAQDDMLRGLLLLHGLHPFDLEARVTQALDKVRPYLGSHGGNVELLGIDDGVVHLRLQGSCNGCASSAVTLKLAIEEAIQEFAPDVVRLQVEGVVERPPAGFIPLAQIGKRPASKPAPAGPGRWENVEDLAALATGATRTLEVGGRRVLFCRLDGTFYAYDDSCPACGQALGAARLAATALTCLACGNSYDVMRAGRCLDQPALHLEPLPLLIEQGRARVALPA